MQWYAARSPRARDTHTLGYLPVPALFALTLMALLDADAGAGAGVCVVQLVGGVSCQGCNLVF